MYVLGIDSSGSISAVCLTRDRELVAEYHFRHDMGLLRRLTPEAENLLSSAGIEPSELGALAVSLGPGSFTGLRIGLACAKAMAFALNIPIVGVPTLKAIAANAACMDPGATVCSMTFARADEVYYGIFDSALREKRPCSIKSIGEVLAETALASGRVVFTGTGCRRNREAIESVMGDRALFAPEICDFARGLTINSLALDRLEAGERDDPASLAPMYIKKPTPVIRKESKK